MPPSPAGGPRSRGNARRRYRPGRAWRHGSGDRARRRDRRPRRQRSTAPGCGPRPRPAGRGSAGRHRGGSRWTGCPGARPPPTPAGTVRRGRPAGPRRPPRGCSRSPRRGNRRAWRARTTSGAGTPNVKLTTAGGVGQQQVELAWVVVVVPLRVAERGPERSCLRREHPKVGGQSFGVGRRPARQEEVHPEVTPHRRPARRPSPSTGPRRSCSPRRESRRRRRATPPPPGRRSTAHRPWARPPAVWG